MPPYLEPLIYWTRREAWRVLPPGHALFYEWQALRRLLDPEDFARSSAEVARIRAAPGIPPRGVAELRLRFARRWAQLYHAHTGDDIADHPDAELPLLDARGRPVHQLALAL